MDKERDQIEAQYKWDLKTIYKNKEAFLEEFNCVQKRVEAFKETDFLNNADSLYHTLKEFFDIDMYLDKMWSYTSQKHDEDIANNENQTYKEKVINLYNKFSENTAFLMPKILEFGEDKIKAYLKENENLKKEYAFVLEDLFREKPHTLSLAEEKLMSSLNKAFSDTNKIASMLTDSEMDFGFIKDENGKEVKLTDTNYMIYISSKDRRVRKEAFETLYNGYQKFNNTLALALASHVDKMVALSKVRKYSSARASALFDDNIDEKVYDNLIDTISKNLEPLYDYYKLKKEILNLDEMHMYDIYVDIADDINNTYTYAEAKDLVLKALSVLGDDYVHNLNKAFDERWIDVYPNKGKRNGAYSGGSYLTKPFLLLNFLGEYHDISTLAHELGHSMHTYYSKENNPYQYSSYRIFVAEVASQVNELLLNDYMFKHSQTKKEKINILNQILELFKASIFRQTMFAEFEKIIFDKNEQGEIITAEVLNKEYYKLVQKYYGDNVVIDESIKYEWSRIPHFYYNFYVYKYSTGLAAAAYIVKNILSGKEKALENYLEFLKTGGRMYPLEELKIAGVDLTKPEVIEGAMTMFQDYLNDLKELLK